MFPVTDENMQLPLGKKEMGFFLFYSSLGGMINEKMNEIMRKISVKS